MNIKSYIAVFMVTVFIAKFIAVDAKALNLLFSEEGINLVHFQCKKEQAQYQKSDQKSSVSSQLETQEVIAFNGDCTPQYQLELFTWALDTSSFSVDYNTYMTSKLRYMYYDNSSPPPRLA